MTDTIPHIAKIKNQWLAEQVDVQYPTKESLAGRKLYLAKAEQQHFTTLDTDIQYEPNFAQEDIFLVDFHRLTVMFSLLQSQRWDKPEEQELIVEFLTQIIYSEPCQLYLGFSNGEPVAAAVVTTTDDAFLISDVVVNQASDIENCTRFALSIANKLSLNISSSCELYLEVTP